MTPEVKQMVAQAFTGGQSTSINELAEGFILYSRMNCSTGTLPARISRIKNFVQFMNEVGLFDISSLNNEVVRIYFEHGLVNLSQPSINAAKKVIRSFIGWIDDKGVEHDLNLSYIKMGREGKRTRRYLEFDIIDKAIKSQDVQYLDRLLIAVASMTGLRASEISGMKLSDITDDRLHVNGKGDNDRTVTIPRTVQRMIDTYVEIAPYRIGEDDYLFKSYWRGEWRQITAKTIWRRIKHVFGRFGVEATTHWLRHSYAVFLLLQGCDIITIQRSLGHSSVSVTQQYLDIADTVVSSQIHKYFD